MLRLTLAYVASVSVRPSMSKERERESTAARKMAQVKETLPHLSFFSSRFISRVVKTRNPLPRSSFLRN